MKPYLLPSIFLLAISALAEVSGATDLDPASATSIAEQLVSLNAQRLALCQYYPWDDFCGATQAAVKNNNEFAARDNLIKGLSQLSGMLLEPNHYPADVADLNKSYDTATDDMKLTLQALAIQLNESWLERYRPEFERWLTEAGPMVEDKVVDGWAIFATVIALRPGVGQIPLLQRFLRVRLPWSSAFFAATAGAMAFPFDHWIEPARPDIPPPPFEMLRFGQEDVGNDYRAELDHAEFIKLQNRYFTGTAILTMMGSDMIASLASEATMLARFVTLGRVLALTRVTPWSFVAGLVLGEGVSWLYSVERWRSLKNAFLETPESSEAGEDVSLAINGLQILSLNEIDNKVRTQENLLKDLGNRDLSNEQIQREFMSALYENDYRFAKFQGVRRCYAAHEFADSLRGTYLQYDKQVQKFMTYLSTLQVTSPVKKDILARRISTLDRKRTELQQKYNQFSTGRLVQRLIEVFPFRPDIVDYLFPPEKCT